MSIKFGLRISTCDGTVLPVCVEEICVQDSLHLTRLMSTLFVSDITYFVLVVHCRWKEKDEDMLCLIINNLDVHAG